MASKWETGHGVNIANFGIMIERCEEFGGAYQPGNAEISIAGMRAKLSKVEALQREYIVALEATKIPINERELLFGEILKTAVRVVNVYETTNASELSVKDARGFLNKLTGRNVKVKRLEDGSRDPKYVSNSRQSYVMKTEHWAMLVNFLKYDSNYTPNEATLQVASLEALLVRAKESNEIVDGLMAELIVRRTARDHALYDAGKGLVDVTLLCKKYVRAVFGGRSPEAKTVDGIRIRRFYRM
jgi:hypothetical protein